MHYKKLAMKLFDNGYSPIPVKPKSKIPFMAKGESWQVEIDQAQVQEWQENGKGTGGVAFTGLCAVDFDIYNKDISNSLVRYIKGNIESAILRIGQKPKFLVPCHADSDIKSKWKNTWYDPDGQKHEIEFLSAGDQYFIGYGIHPDTGQEFEWLWGDPFKVAADDLVVIDELDIAGIEDEFERLCSEAGFTRGKNNKNNNKKNKKKIVADDPLESMKAGGNMRDAAGIAELTAWLDLLPDDWSDDRDNWITIGAAIHHETAGSGQGWLLFDQWSQRSKKYKGKSDTVTRWESFDKDKGVKAGDDCVSRGTIIHILKEAGLWEKAQQAGNKARNSVGVLEQKKGEEKAQSDIIKQMNNKHAIIRINSKIRIMQECKTIDNNLDLSFLSLADFGLKYSNQRGVDPKDPKKQKPITKIWLDNPNRREYDGVVFEPTGSKKTAKQLEGYYNMWRGLQIKPKKGEWGRFKEHIYEVVADGDEGMGNWVVAWVARIIQKPGGERPGTCIVLKGGQGTGKGVFVNTVGKIFGDHFMPVSHASQVAGRFNSHLTNKILVFIDEGFWAGDKKHEGVLKSMITEPYLAIEQKGVDIIKIKNNINLMMASNSEWVVPANIAERRFCVLDVSEKKQGNKSYFNKIIQEVKAGGLEAMTHDMIKMDLSKIDLSRFTHTQGLYEQKIHSFSTEMHYWHERLMDGDLLKYRDVLEETSDFSDYSKGYDNWGRVDCEILHRDYLLFSEKQKEKYPKTKTQLGIFLHHICPGVIKKRGTSGDRKYFYHFPNLQESRLSFEEQIKQTISWDMGGDNDEDLF